MSDVCTVKGTVASVEKNISKAGNEWAIVSVLVPDEYQGEDRSYQLPMKVFGRLASDALALSSGDSVTVVVKPKGSYWEKGDRWFVDLAVMSIHGGGSNSKANKAPEDTDDLPW